MVNHRYLEFDSTYRDRTLYPLPSSFSINISQSGLKSKLTATDPISDAAPLLSFNGHFNILAPSFRNTTGTISSMVPAAVSEHGNTSAAYDVIVTFTANTLNTTENFYTGSVLLAATAGTPERRRILAYKYVGNDNALFTIDSAFTSAVIDAAVVTIANPSDTLNIFIPTGSEFNNQYINMQLQNTTLGETKTITYYNGTTRMASVSSAYSSWASTHNFVLRKTGPQETGALAAGATTRSFVLPGTSSAISEYYTGDFIRITSGGAIGDIRRIISYDGATLTGQVFPAFTAAPAGADTYEILLFSRDNVVPFNYTGSMVSQQELTCYDIELINVIVPNKTLNVGQGRRLPFYPYIYVELSNEGSTSSSAKNAIYSNNPNAVNVLFRATIDDTSQPTSSNFLKFNGDNMIQTIKFKINDNMKFSVRLNSGELLNTVETERFSPQAPNPDIQISAIFCLRRVA